MRTEQVAVDICDAMGDHVIAKGYHVLEEPDDVNRIEGGWSFVLVASDGTMFDVVVAPA